jgi:rRNA maturation endonuclease Nob1
VPPGARHSRTQVSIRADILLNVGSGREQPEFVRCAACHRLYDLTAETAKSEEGGCPDCGGMHWLAENVPVEETASTPPE